MVAVRFVAVFVVVVLAMSVTVPEKSDAVADCHLVILPVCPLNVNVVLLVPVHRVAPPLILPPTLAGLTVIVTAVEYTYASTEVLDPLL